MHELHLMAQVVKAVEAGLKGAPNARASVIRLKVNALSHLLSDDRSALQAAFALAVRGTVAEGATLEIITVSDEAWCPHCEARATGARPDEICPTCGELMIVGEDVPEVMVHEVVVEE